MNARDDEVFTTKYGVVIWSVVLGLGFLLLCFLIAALTGTSTSVREEPSKVTFSDPDRTKCIEWLVENHVGPVSIFEGAPFGSEADLIRWMDENLDDLRMISLGDKRNHDDDLRYLSYLPGVRWLFLDTDTTRLTSVGLQQFRHCPRLTRVDIGGSSTMPSDWVKALASLGTIMDWNFLAPVTDECLDVLGNTGSPITDLSIDSADALTEKAYRSIGRLRDLERLLILCRRPLSDGEMRDIARCTKLKVLCLGYAEKHVSDEMIRTLVSLPALRSVHLECDTDLSNATLLSLANRPLKDFYIVSPRIIEYMKRDGMTAESALERLVKEAVAEKTTPSTQETD